jgi:hypothetical protein
MKTTVRIPCPYCNASGSDPDEPSCACQYCMGAGHLDIDPEPPREAAPEVWAGEDGAL